MANTANDDRGGRDRDDNDRSDSWLHKHADHYLLRGGLSFDFDAGRERYDYQIALRRIRIPSSVALTGITCRVRVATTKLPAVVKMTSSTATPATT